MVVLNEFVEPLRVVLANGIVDASDSNLNELFDGIIAGTTLKEQLYVQACLRIIEHDMEDSDAIKIIEKVGLNYDHLNKEVRCLFIILISQIDIHVVNLEGMADDYDLTVASIKDILDTVDIITNEIAMIKAVKKATNNDYSKESNLWCHCGFQKTGDKCNECCYRNANMVFVGPHAPYIVRGKGIIANTHYMDHSKNNLIKVNGQTILSSIYTWQCNHPDLIK